MTKISWFKLLWLNSEEREALKRGLAQKEEPAVEAPKPIVELAPIDQRPYKSIIYSNGTVTVILKDDTTLSQANVSRELVIDVAAAKTETDIHMLLFGNTGHQTPAPTPLETREDIKKVYDNLQSIRNNQEFTIDEKGVYLKGVNLPLPTIVLATFIEILEKLESYKAHAAVTPEQEELEDSFTALKMFWLKLALSPLAQCREDLLRFVKMNDVRITKNGNLVLYRRIVSIEGQDKQLASLISLEYAKIKKRKKSPKNYLLAKKGEEYITVELFKASKVVTKDSGHEVLGNLYDLYKSLDTIGGNKFTSWHKKGVHTIQLGNIYKIEDKDINLDNGLCAAGGLHAAAVNYNYEGFGDTPVVVLVNPSKAITVPTGEVGKLRTTEMFVACVNDQPHGRHFDEASLNSFDEEYHDRTLQELVEIVATKDFTSIKVEGRAPALQIQDVVNIKNALQGRIQTIS